MFYDHFFKTFLWCGVGDFQPVRIITWQLPSMKQFFDQCCGGTSKALLLLTYRPDLRGRASFVFLVFFFTHHYVPPSSNFLHSKESREARQPVT